MSKAYKRNPKIHQRISKSMIPKPAKRKVWLLSAISRKFLKKTTDKQVTKLLEKHGLTMEKVVRSKASTLRKSLRNEPIIVVDRLVSWMLAQRTKL